MLVRDISFLARLVSDESMHQDRARDELVALSPIFQPVARRLVTALPDERQPIWDDFLAGRLRADPMTTVAAKSVLEESPTRALADETAPGDAQQSLATAPGARLVEAGRRVKMTCAVDLKPRSVDWLWSGRVPLGMITMFAGDPKLGKSYVTLAMAAALSHGRSLPMSDRPDRPGSTILMSAEDDPARTIVPRLVAGGADLTKIHILESVIHANGSEALPSLRADIDAITAAAARLGDCRLIVIDPVSAYLNGVDDHRNTALRGVLTPLNRLAERLNAAVVLVNHLTKAGSANGKHRVLGSIAYVGACRANHLFVADPDDPTGRRVLMVDNGSNIAPPAPVLAYTISNRDSGARIEWSDEPMTRIAANSLKPARFAQLDHAEQFAGPQECDDWLRAFLAEGRRPPAEIFKAASDAGYSKNRIRRAKSRIGVMVTKEGFATSGQWSWTLIPAPEADGG
jgi:putative DNA primase/helicase